MQFFIFIIVALAMFSAITTSLTHAKKDAPVAVSAARAQIDQYRLFMYVANEYMRNYSGGAQTITWQTLKTLPWIPSGARQGGMPASWKVVAAADNTWVACTELDERTVGVLEQLANRSGQGFNQATLTGQSYIVVGQAEDIGKASQCN